MLDRYTQANRDLWNDWTDIHVGSAFYDLESFKAGGCALRPLEVDELGDVRGSRRTDLARGIGRGQGRGLSLAGLLPADEG